MASFSFLVSETEEGIEDQKIILLEIDGALTGELCQDYRLSDGPLVMTNLLQNRCTLYHVTFSMLLATWVQIRMK